MPRWCGHSCGSSRCRRYRSRDTSCSLRARQGRGCGCWVRGSTGAGGQRTVSVVAFAVRVSGPSAKRFGLIGAFLPKNGREYDGNNEQKRDIEARADHGADVEIAAAAAAFGVRRHAHGDACACGGRQGRRCAVR